MSNYHLLFTDQFFKRLHELDELVFKKWKKVGKQIQQDPFHPSLSSHQVQSAEHGVYSSRLDDNYRILFRYIKPNYILLFWVDTHDAAYKKAERTKVTLEDAIVKIVDTYEIRNSSSFEENQSPLLLNGILFSKFTDEELLKIGVSKEQLNLVRKCNSYSDLSNLEGILHENIIYSLVDLLDQKLNHKSHIHPHDIQLTNAIKKNQISDELLLFEKDKDFEKAMSGSLWEWMIFLHPTQKKFVKAEYNGPVLIKGGAGTGKTVLAVHRARYLAKNFATNQNDKILFLTYNKCLSNVIQELLGLICSTSEIQKIEIKTLHQWCYHFLKEQCNISLDNLKEYEIKNHIQTAIQTINEKYKNQKYLNLSSDFIQEEIEYVIKGKGIQSLEEYLNIKRSGRGKSLGQEERKIIYEIFLEYKKLCGSKLDWEDYILKSIDYIQLGYLKKKYKSVIVDEAQDISEAGMRLIGMLAQNGSNNLLIIGDGNQKIYKAPYSLKNTGISVVGRSFMLKYNYRNTRQILEAACCLINNKKSNALLEEINEIVSIPELPLRVGQKPILQSFSSKLEEIIWTVQKIENLIQTKPYKLGDIGILFKGTNNYYLDLSQVLSQNNIPHIHLKRDRGEYIFDEDKVKLCTFHSAKGLEFKVVFLLGLSENTIPGELPTDPEELEEKLNMERNLLYVAMTRARDLLYLSYVGNSGSRFLRDIKPDLIEKNVSNS